MSERGYVTKDSEVLGGAPVIVGTRIPVERLGWLIQQGYTEDTLAKEFPHVSRQKIRGALFELIQNGAKTI